MKLVYCPNCGDVVRLIHQKWRRCACGKSGGQYNEDLMTATIGGESLCFGVGNYFFNDMWKYLEDEQKQEYRSDNVSSALTVDCWWSAKDGRGDFQVIRIESAKGPRIQMKVGKKIDKRGRIKVTITDKREYTVKGKRLKTLDPPYNARPSFRIP